MHLGNGALTPECAMLTWGVATAGLGIASWGLREEKLTTDRALAAGGLTAAVFAAQMFNIQVVPLGVSGHFLGGTLLCWTLGPSLGAILMALILAAQALALGDGGLAAWGANVINMALLPAALTRLAKLSLAEDGSTWARGLTLAGVSAATVIGGAMLVVLEVVFARGFEMVDGLGDFTGAMFVNHLAIAIVEAGLTIGLAALLTWDKLPACQDLPQDTTSRMLIPRAAWPLGLALVLVPLAIWIGSPLPDGYEAAVETSGLSEVLAIQSAGNLAAIEDSQQAIAGFFSDSLPGEFALAILATLFVGGAATALTLITLIGNRQREEAKA